MRQFILGGKVAYPTQANDLTKVAEGAVGIYYLKDGVPTPATKGNEFTKEAMIVLGRPVDKGGPVILPLFNNNFSYVKGEYQAASKFVATITIPAPKTVGDYSIIVALKGTKFNERNKWTGTVHVKDTSMSAAILAQKLTNAINANVGSDVTATVSTATITITANKAGVDYAVIGADLLFNVQASVTTQGLPAYGDAKYVQDLAEKAAADSGFEYTYRDAYYYLYPDYPLNPLKAADAADTGFTIFTLRFAEPRDVKTRDEAVNQIVQVAFPTGATGITAFETVCKGMAEGVAPTTVGS